MNPDMLPFDEALSSLLAKARPIREMEMVDTLMAHGRVLAADVRSPFAVPALDTSMMDGY